MASEQVGGTNSQPQMESIQSNLHWDEVRCSSNRHWDSINLLHPPWPFKLRNNTPDYFHDDSTGFFSKRTPSNLKFAFVPIVGSKKQAQFSNKDSNVHNIKDLYYHISAYDCFFFACWFQPSDDLKQDEVITLSYLKLPPIISLVDHFNPSKYVLSPPDHHESSTQYLQTAHKKCPKRYQRPLSHAHVSEASCWPLSSVFWMKINWESKLYFLSSQTKSTNINSH